MKPGSSEESSALDPPPRSATTLFGDRLPVVERYATLLATDGVVRGLIGPRESPRLWSRHVVNCGLLARAVPAGSSVADIGSGAGLPGLVVAIARPDAQVTLVEPLLRRTSFLSEVVAELGLPNVVVRRGRADVLHGEEAFDVVTARAVAPLSRLLEWCMPLVAPTGALLAMKGEGAADEIAAARTVLRRLGCAEPTAEVHGEDLAREDAAVDPIRVVRVTWADPARVSLPASTAGGRRGGRSGSRRARRPGRRGSRTES